MRDKILHFKIKIYAIFLGLTMFITNFVTGSRCNI